LQNRTSNIRREDNDRILVYGNEESKIQESPGSGFRMTKQQKKLQGGNTGGWQKNNDSNVAENEFLNKAHPILDVSLTGERNNISTLV